MVIAHSFPGWVVKRTVKALKLMSRMISAQNDFVATRWGEAPAEPDLSAKPALHAARLSGKTVERGHAVAFGELGLANVIEVKFSAADCDIQ
jgi:hypothetical protein